MFGVGAALLFAVGNADTCVQFLTGEAAPWDGKYSSNNGLIQEINLTEGMLAPLDGTLCKDGASDNASSEKCLLSDMMALFGDEEDDARRRFGPIPISSKALFGDEDVRRRFGPGENPFANVPAACLPCVEGCMNKAFPGGISSIASGTLEEPTEDTMKVLMTCMMSCPETDFPGHCELEELTRIQEETAEDFANGGDISQALTNPFGSVEGLSGGCKNCLTKCAEATILEAFTQLGNALDGAFDGGDLSGLENLEDLNIEDKFEEMGTCMQCCVGMEMSAASKPVGHTCKSAFGAATGLSFAASGGGSGSDAGMIAGIVIGVLVALALGAGLAYYCHAKNKNTEALNPPGYQDQEGITTAPVHYTAGDGETMPEI